MSKPLKCPQCGAGEASLLQEKIYQCKFCGSIYEYGDAKPDFDNKVRKQKPVTFDTQQTSEAAKKIIQSVVWFFMIATTGIAAAIFFITKNNVNNHKSDKPFVTAKNLYSRLNENTYFFTVVNAKAGPQVWTISRINSERLTEVDYYLNQIDVNQNKIVHSEQIGTTIVWKQSNEDAYRMNQPKPIGQTCWIIYGEQLLGYDINTYEQVVNNQVLIRKFSELRKGIAKIEDVYDMTGFKLTTKEGYIYYYLPEQNKIITEEAYKDKNNGTDKLEPKTEYSFTDAERQQLYKIDRKINPDLYTKLPSSTVGNMVRENDGWYKRVYNIENVKEFTPDAIYFNASVLYNDDKKVIIVYQKELGESSPLLLAALDTNGKEIWIKNNIEPVLLNPFKKSTNAGSFLQGEQLVMMQPYQIAVCFNISNGEVNWSFKPY